MKVKKQIVDYSNSQFLLYWNGILQPCKRDKESIISYINSSIDKNLSKYNIISWGVSFNVESFLNNDFTNYSTN